MTGVAFERWKILTSHSPTLARTYLINFKYLNIIMILQTYNSCTYSFALCLRLKITNAILELCMCIGLPYLANVTILFQCTFELQALYCNTIFEYIPVITNRYCKYVQAIVSTQMTYKLYPRITHSTYNTVFLCRNKSRKRYILSFQIIFYIKCEDLLKFYH